MITQNVYRGWASSVVDLFRLSVFPSSKISRGVLLWFNIGDFSLLKLDPGWTAIVVHSFDMANAKTLQFINTPLLACFTACFYPVIRTTAWWLYWNSFHYKILFAMMEYQNRWPKNVFTAYAANLNRTFYQFTVEFMSEHSWYTKIAYLHQIKLSRLSYHGAFPIYCSSTTRKTRTRWRRVKTLYQHQWIETILQLLWIKMKPYCVIVLTSMTIFTNMDHMWYHPSSCHVTATLQVWSIKMKSLLSNHFNEIIWH